MLDAAAAVAVVGLAAWIVEVAIRWTARVADARDVAAGTATPASEPAVGSWLVFALAAVGFLVPMVCSWVLARRRLPGRRSSLAAAAVATLASLAALGAMAPSMIYQFGLLPLGLTLVLAGRRSGAPVPQTSGSWAS